MQKLQFKIQQEYTEDTSALISLLEQASGLRLMKHVPTDTVDGFVTIVSTGDIEIAIDEKRYNESIKNKLDTAILTFTSN